MCASDEQSLMWCSSLTYYAYNFLGI